MAELFLLRNDLIQVSTTSRHTLRVLPVGKNVQQKVVVGDDSGVVHAFSIKKGELVTAFKTLPTGQPVTRIVLGSGPAQGDKIFVASGQAIRGLAKKGKEFFRFDTNLTETINSVYVQELAVLTGGEYIYNFFQDCKDINFYLAHDRINDMTAVSIGKDGQLNPVLACQDRYVRVLQGSNLYYEAAVGGPVTCVEKYATRAADIRTTRDVIYGTQTGELGLLTMESDSIRRGWVKSASGGVSCICTRADITKDSANSIVVGRDNGDIEVYSVTNGVSKLRVKKNIGESVLSIDCGCVSTPGVDDIVVLTFSGKVIAFSCSADAATATANQQAEKKLKAMKKDIDALQERLVQERDRVLSRPQVDIGAAGGIPATVAREAGLKATLKSSFSPSDMAYTLSLETQMPIASIAVQCDIEVELLDGDASSSNTLVTRCKPDNQSGCATLAICHTQEPTNRMSISFKALEGQSATLAIYPIPRVSPRTCAPLHFRILPLCLHQRVTELPQQPHLQPFNELRITGAFSHSEMHAWIYNCLPDIPGRAPADDNSEYVFVSTKLGTTLVCQNRQGSAVFKSENATTLAIVKDFITKEADARKVRINATVTVDDNTLHYVIDLLDKTLSRQSLYTQQVQLLEALQEVKMQEEDMSCFAPEYLNILKGADEIRQGYSLQKLRALHDIVKNLFVDWHKFKGLTVRSKLPQLEHVLNTYSKDSLLHFMQHAA